MRRQENIVLQKNSVLIRALMWFHDHSKRHLYTLYVVPNAMVHDAIFIFFVDRAYFRPYRES